MFVTATDLPVAASRPASAHRFSHWLCVALALCLAGCAADGAGPTLSSQTTEAEGQSTSGAAARVGGGAAKAAVGSGTGAPNSQSSSLSPRGYQLGPGDKLRIMVFNEAEMSREYEVDTAGKVTLALIGAVDAAGSSPSELQERIRQALAKGFLRDPKVSVEVVSYRPFYVIGEVTKSGEYPYKNGMNVISAVAVAGGYTYRADTRRVFLRRANETSEASFDISSGLPVYPGDIVRIPERFF